MGSRPRSSTRIGSSVVIAIAAPLLLLAAPAHAQSHADAGVQHHHAAAVPAPAPTEPADTPPAGGLKTIPNPGQLSENTRARLQEQAAGKHPSALAQEPPRPLHELPSAATPPAGSALGAPAFRRVENEPLRRGEAHMRRVQAVETVEGVTLLSNRIQLPERSVAALAMHKPAPREALDDEPLAASDSRVTETHSLRTYASRTVTPKTHSTGLGWLLWPFVLFISTGAVVGTLWFRKKVD